MEELHRAREIPGLALVLLPRIMGNFCVRVFFVLFFSTRMPHPDINPHCTVGKPVGRLFISN